MGIEVTYRVFDDEGIVNVVLDGEIDLSRAAELGHALTKALALRPRVVVVVDLERVSFLDSTGINSLVNAARDAEAVQSRLVVRNAAGIVRKVLDITGIGALLDETDDDDNAIASERVNDRV